MDEVLRVRVLGTADLALGGRTLVGRMPAKAVALVVYLALAGGAHRRSELAGLLWSDLPEETARANLRVVLTKLRRVLPEHVVVTRRDVRLTVVPPVWLDADEVARATADDLAPEDLLDAVRLCRGDLLEGFTVPGAPVFDDWVDGRRAAVRAETLALMDRVVAQARDRRDVATGIEVARRMLGTEPLLEEAHRALMWFLALGGHRSAALAQYETCRYLLREELGAVPSAPTLALRDEITRTGSFTGLAGDTPPGPGPRAGRGGAAGEPIALPRSLTTLVGREAELARLRVLLEDPACRLLTLVGPGGIGKTRLATELVGSRREDHRDEVAFVSFVGTETPRAGEAPGLVVTTVARALGVSLAAPLDPLDLLADHLAPRRTLLLLDNLEHLRDGAGAVAELLRRAPALTLVVTSRRPLGLGPEWVVEVPGLPCPPVGSDADAGDYAAVRLFHDRARLLRPGYRAVAADAAAARVCRLVAGVPLAIELAARWVRALSPTTIADRLEEGVDLLETTSPDVEQRHRSLRSVVDASYDLLTEDERTVFRQLSVLRHGFDVDAAAAVAGADLRLLAGLVDHSLVVSDEDGRYAMHELLRQVAAERLAADPAEHRLTRQRHADHFCGVLASGAPDGGPSVPVADVENMRAATEWVLAHASPSDVDAHLVRLWSVYRRSGRFREAQAVLGAALARDDATALQSARWHRMLGEAHQQLGEAHVARHHLELALRLLGLPVPASTSGWLRVLVGQTVRRSLRRAQPSVRGRRDDLGSAAHERASAGFTINEVYWVLEDHVPMLPSSLRALNDAELTADVGLAVRARAGVAMTVGTMGLRRLAERELRASDAAFEAGPRDALTACWLAMLGGLHRSGVGDWQGVEAAAARALELQRDAPAHRLADQVLLIAGCARYHASRYPGSAAAASAALTAGRDRRDPVVQFWGLVILIETALRASPDDPAIALWTAEATPLLPRVARVDAARLHGASARVHLAAGRPAEAWEAVRSVHQVIGPRAAFEPYTLEAHAVVPEVCLSLLEAHRAGTAGAAGTDPVTLRATADAGLRRLDRYARTFPVARPRALVCAGRAAWLDGRPRAARHAWRRAVHEAERLQMPYELARAHDELGRHDDGSRRADARAHLEQALTGYRAAGCPADVDRVRALLA